MIIRMEGYAKIFWLILPIALAIPFLSASAQSGRAVKVPQPTPTPRSTSSSQSNAKPNFDGNGDLYKLIFPTEATGERSRDRVDKERVRHAYLNNFIGQLNEAGSKGYKLISVVASHPLVALVKLDESPHEYDWFETDSKLAFSVGKFEEKYAKLLERGFHLADHALLSKYCEDIDPDNSLMGQDCEFRHLFLVERQIVGGEKPVQFERVRSAPVRGSKPAIELTTQVKEKLAEGFYPTGIFSAFEVLVERPAKSDGSLEEMLDVQVVRASSFWERDNLEEKVNEKARQGYRMALVNKGIAVMYRPDEAAAPVTYVWVKATDKGFEKRLLELQSKAVYRMTYPDDDGDETKLIFEQGAGVERREYRVLKFEFKYTENAEGTRELIDLTPSGEEALNSLHSLVREGFAVRDLLYSNRSSFLNGASVILERLYKE